MKHPFPSGAFAIALAAVCLSLGSGLRAQTAATLTTLHSFTSGEGSSPVGTLAQGGDGSLYGVTSQGGVGAGGTIFQVKADGTLATLFSFVDPSPNFINDTGFDPQAGVIVGTDGALYGTTYGGGANGFGTVFSLVPGGAPVALHSFGDTTVPLDGENPLAGLVLARDGLFYGTTSSGGNGSGAIYSITSSGTLNLLHALVDADGASPAAALIQGRDGNFYGTTQQGGDNGFGTIFQATAAGVVTKLGEPPAFGISDGPLVQGADGSFYGTIPDDGGFGSLYSVAADGTENIVYSFSGSDGTAPHGGLCLGRDGNFYGTTQQGGANGFGTVFQLTPDGVLTTLHDFTGGADGGNPVAGLLQGSNGAFYGTTITGGANANGTVFYLAPGPTITSADSAVATIGTPFSYQIVGTYNPTSYTATGLPAGLSVDASSGLISGTPTQLGTSTVNLTATNANGVGTATLALTVVAPPPVITSAASASGQVGKFFLYQIAGTNSPTSFRATGLPGGIGINVDNGVIAGAPFVAGVYPITVEAINSGGVATATLTLTVEPPPSGVIVTLAATTPTVTVGSGLTGVFTITLASPQSSDLTVNYTVKGTAGNGVDYVLLSGTKKVKAGKTSKPIKVVPLGNLGGAAKKAVKLTLAAGTGYTVGTTTFAKVKILAAQ